MTRNLGRVGGSQAGRHARRWAGGLAALSLAMASSAAGQQAARPATTVRPAAVTPTAVAPAAVTPAAAAPRTYAECLRLYANQRNATAYCQRLFPNATPAAATPSTTAPPATTSMPTPATPPPTREPVDITPQLDKLIDAWRNRPKTPPRPPADPLAVVPEIQAACAPYASVPERWRRCTADAWRTARLRGQPPLVLQNPPVVEPPPSPVVQSPPPVQPPVVSQPPVQTPPAITPTTVEPEPVLEPAPPPVAVIEPPRAPQPPPAAVVPPSPPQAPPAPKAPSTPIWFWLIALVAAASGGFGVAKLLSRKRPPSSRPPNVVAAPCPQVALVADPGVVVLTPDGPPRAGMAVSLRFETAVDGGEVKLDYPTLETAP